MAVFATSIPQSRAERTPGEAAVSAYTAQVERPVHCVAAFPPSAWVRDAFALARLPDALLLEGAGRLEQTHASAWVRDAFALARLPDALVVPYLEHQAKTKTDVECLLGFLDGMRSKVKKHRFREHQGEWQGVTVCHAQPKWFVWCECAEDSNHQFAKELHCGREWCRTCGAKWSDSHQRRFARWLPKALQICDMGYFVFTLPPELRKCYRTASELSLLGRQITSLLKSFGFSRGLRRWHVFGDEWFEGQAPVYHPHLNVLVDGSHLPRHVLDSMRDAWATLLGVPEAVMHYSYLKWPAQKVHALKYITRGTFLNIEWDRELAHQLWNFRNTVAFGGKGRWSDAPAWQLSPAETEGMETIAPILENRCPDCGSPLIWKEQLLPQWVVDRIPHTVLGAGFIRFDTS